MSETESAISNGDQEALLDCVVIEPAASARWAVIWLHGLGADGHDFESIVPQLNLPPEAGVRFVFPHAPVRPVTINSGMAMRAWYDISGINLRRDQDTQGIADSVKAVQALIKWQNQRGIDTSQIVLAGFSQGGAMAMHVALRYPEQLAGIIALSSYLLFADQLADQASQANADIPVFIGHGSMDPVVPFPLGEMTAKQLKETGHPVEWRSYPMPHSVCLEQIVHLGAWLRNRVE